MQGRCRGNGIAPGLTSTRLSIPPPGPPSTNNTPKAFQSELQHRYSLIITSETPPYPLCAEDTSPEYLHPPAKDMPSSPDPLQDLDGPSIYNATPAPRTVRRTSSMASSLFTSNRKLSHTTANPPTRSPWRIHVYVEAERDNSGDERSPMKRSRTTRTRTTMVPLRGLSLSPRAPTEGMEMVVHQRRKMTPVRRRWGSINATPGGPGRTPGKSATPMLQEEQRVDYDDEGIGSMMDGIENENENDEVDLVGTRSRAKPTPHKTPARTPHGPRAKTPATIPAKTPRRSPIKQAPAVASPITTPRRSKRILASSSKNLPKPPELIVFELSDEDDDDHLSNHNAPSVASSRSESSPSPEPSKPASSPKPMPSPEPESPPEPIPSRQRRSPSKSMPPPSRPLLDFGAPASSTGSNDDDMEGFSMVDTGSLIPDFMNSISQHQDADQPSPYPYPAETTNNNGDMLSEFAFASNSLSYAPRQRSPAPTPLVGTEPFSGSGFRSSPPLFQRLALTKGKGKSVPKPLLQQPQPQPQSARKRKRGTPALDFIASEGLRSTMGVEESLHEGRGKSMSMTSERLGGGLEDGEEEGGFDTDSDTVGGDVDEDLDPDSILPSPEEEEEGEEEEARDGKGKGKLQEEPSSPLKSVRFLPHESLLEVSWAAERAAVKSRAGEVGSTVIADSDLEEDSLEADRIVEDMWLAEAEPRSQDTPMKRRGGRRTLEEQWRKEQWRDREAVKRRAAEVETVVIEEEEEEEEDEEEQEEQEGEFEEYRSSPAIEAAEENYRSSPMRKTEQYHSSPRHEHVEEEEEEEVEEEEEEVEEEEEEEEVEEEDEDEKEYHSSRREEAKVKQYHNPPRDEEAEVVEEGDSYDAAPGGTTMLGQDTAAFEESLFHREQQQLGTPIGNLFTSSSTPYKRGSSISDGRESDTSESSPPSSKSTVRTSRWRARAKQAQAQAQTTPAAAVSTNVGLRLSARQAQNTPAAAVNKATSSRVSIKQAQKTPAVASTATSSWESVKRIQTTPAVVSAATSSWVSAKPVSPVVIETAGSRASVSVGPARITADTNMGPPAMLAMPAVTAAIAATTAAMQTATAIIATARERREARAKQREEMAAAIAAAEAAAAAAAAAKAAEAAATAAEAAGAAAAAAEAAEAAAAADVAADVAAPPSVDESVNMLPDDLLTPPLSFASTARIPSPPLIGPAWEKRHWRLLESFMLAADAKPPAGRRLTYMVSIDDPAALDDDPDALLADPELKVATMQTGEKALVLGAREIEAVRRFRERMESEGGEREQWSVQEVAAKVGALMLAAVRRRRRRAERTEKGVDSERWRVRRRRKVVEKGKEKENTTAGKGKEKAVEKVKEKVVEKKAVEKVRDKVVEKEKVEKVVEKEKAIEKENGAVLGRMEMAALRAERRKLGKPGSRLSHWL